MHDPNVDAALVFEATFLVGDYILEVVQLNAVLGRLFIIDPRLTRSEKLEAPPCPLAFFLGYPAPTDFAPAFLFY